MKAIHVSATEAAKQQGARRSWGTQVWMANRAVSRSSLALARMILAPGQSGEQHRHPNADEVIYLFRGNVAVSVGNETFLLQAADALTVPGGLTHRIENISNEEAEMILAYSVGEREYVSE